MSDSEHESPSSQEEYEPSVGSWDEDDEIDSIRKNKRKRGKEKNNRKSNSKYRRINFKDDEEEKLIELIKAKPFLYSVTDPLYKERLLKYKAWDEIGTSLSKPVEDCKKKWKNMKDAFDRSKKKLPTGSGTSSQTKRLEILAFLDSSNTFNTKYVFILILSLITNDIYLLVTLHKNIFFSSTVSNISVSDDVLESVDQQSTPVVQHNSSPEIQQHSFLVDQQQQQQQKRRKRNNHDKFDVIIEAMTEISNKKIEAFMKLREDDMQPAIRSFFESVSRTVTSFSSYDQAVIKKKILDLVTEYELKTLQNSSQISSGDRFA